MVVNYQLLALVSGMVLLSLRLKLAGASDIGVCYEMLDDNEMDAKNLPSPTEVVSLYQSNNIGRMRLYEPDSSMFEALRGSGIQILLGVNDADIEQLAQSYTAANDWVEKNIRSYWPDVHFRYIAVGNEVIPSSYAPFVLPAIENLHSALSYGELWQRIKVTTIISPSVMDACFPPSAGNFSTSTIDYLAPIAQYLEGIGAPLLANVYPYFDYVKNPEGTPLPYALFTADNDIFTDSGMGYRNLFDTTIDALYASLEKVGAAKLPIAVSETGWPSVGSSSAASTCQALVYNSNLVNHVLSSQGTPRRPGVPIETYLFSMFNERKNLGGIAGESQFGLFDSDMMPVYPIFH